MKVVYDYKFFREFLVEIFAVVVMHGDDKIMCEFFVLEFRVASLCGYFEEAQIDKDFFKMPETKAFRVYKELSSQFLYFGHSKCSYIIFHCSHTVKRPGMLMKLDGYCMSFPLNISKQRIN